MQREKNVVALGFFDGVHIGHAALLNKVNERARQFGVSPAVLSFDAHPDTIVFGREIPLINSMDGRAELMKRLFGIEKNFVVHFDEKKMHQPWQQFIQNLITESNAVHFVVGHDFHFGYKGEGTAEKLCQYGQEHGVGCDVIPAVKLDGIIVSSTVIRQLLEEGKVEEANRFLGHPHTLTDTVHEGFRLGRTIDFPTINMRFPEGTLVPKHGVYVAKAFFDEREYGAVTNVGIRPTVAGNSSAVSVESFILDYSGDLYGQNVRLEFMSFIRPEKKFDSVAELKAQIARDAESARAFYEKHK